MEQHRPCNSVRYLEMAQMLWGMETIKRSGTKLVEFEVMLLSGMVVSPQDKHSRTGSGADDVIDNPCALHHCFEGKLVHRLLYWRSRRHCRAIHSPLCNPHSRC